MNKDYRPTPQFGSAATETAIGGRPSADVRFPVRRRPMPKRFHPSR
ncbi:MAG: hypothetical protein JWN91_296 [Nocardioides sp.]|jgi:hypothetical protein|nr:hypothetical protein [Nocardioides sp.]